MISIVTFSYLSLRGDFLLLRFLLLYTVFSLLGEFPLSICSLYKTSLCRESKLSRCPMAGEHMLLRSPLVLVFSSPINLVRYSQGRSNVTPAFLPVPTISSLPSTSPSSPSLLSSSLLFFSFLFSPFPPTSLPFLILLFSLLVSSLLFSSLLFPFPFPLSLFHRTPYPNMFQVHTRDRVFLLSAPTDEEMQSWVGMLQTLKQYDKQRNFTRRNCPTSLQNSPLGPPSDPQSPTRRRVASDTDSERKSSQVKDNATAGAKEEGEAKGVLNGRRKSALSLDQTD